MPRDCSAGQTKPKKRLSPVLRGILIIGTLFLTGMGLLGLWTYYLFKNDLSSIVNLIKNPEEAPKSQLANFKAPVKNQAIDLVKRGLALRDPSEISQYFHPGITSPEEIVRFLVSLGKQEGEPEWLGNHNTEHLQIEQVSVTFTDPEGAQKRLALLSPDAEGVWKIDFEAFARKNQPPWEDFIGHDVDTAIVRIALSAGTYYQGAFRSDQEWICFRMESPDRPQLMHGYCKIGSPASRQLQKFFEKGGKEIRVILQLRKVEFAQSYQFEISRVLAEDWILPHAVSR
jgi:hypothetical protein